MYNTVSICILILICAQKNVETDVEREGNIPEDIGWRTMKIWRKVGEMKNWNKNILARFTQLLLKEMFS